MNFDIGIMKTDQPVAGHLARGQLSLKQHPRRSSAASVDAMTVVASNLPELSSALHRSGDGATNASIELELELPSIVVDDDGLDYETTDCLVSLRASENSSLLGPDANTCNGSVNLVTTRQANRDVIADLPPWNVHEVLRFCDIRLI